MNIVAVIKSLQRLKAYLSLMLFLAKEFFFILILLQTVLTVKAQINSKAFFVNGCINTHNGRIRLIPIIDEAYYSNNSLFNQTTIHDGKFYLKGSIDYPCAFRLRIDSANTPIYISGIFFLDAGNQSIICNVDSNWQIPRIENKSMNEYEHVFKPYFFSIENRLQKLQYQKDSLKTIHNNNIHESLSYYADSIYKPTHLLYYQNFLNYVKKHTASYVALWMLANELSFEYNSVYEKIYKAFNSSVKSTITAKVLLNQFSKAKKTAIGAVFPKCNIHDSQFKKISFPNYTNLSEYTLVDFWFSHCNPCIDQFKKLNDIYQKFAQKGFNIIGISTDSKSDMASWKNIIKSKKLTWQQYLDVNGLVAKQLTIIKYPSNFLLNNKGIIIRADITPDDLNEFLSEMILNN